MADKTPVRYFPAGEVSAVDQLGEYQPGDTVAWSFINKVGSSLADLATRSASDLVSGTLPSGRISGVYSGLIGTGTIVSGVWNGSSIGTTYTDAKVVSVSGTLNRVTSSGTNPATVDISASYVGQVSINTVGTIVSGTWQGTAVDATHGGTAQTSWATGDLLYGSGVNTLAKRAVGSTGDVLTVAGGVPTWAAPSTGLTITGTANRITTAGSSPTVIDIAATYVGQASITTVGTLSAGAVPASLVTAGTFGAGAYTFPSSLIVTTTLDAATVRAGGIVAGSSSQLHMVGAGVAGNVFKDTSAGVDGKIWDIFASGTLMKFRTVNDAFSGSATWLQTTRSGTTVSAIDLTATAVNVNGGELVTGGLSVGTSAVPGTGVARVANSASQGILQMGGSATGNPQVNYDQNGVVKGYTFFDNTTQRLTLNRTGGSGAGLSIDSADVLYSSTDIVVSASKGLWAGTTGVDRLRIFFDPTSLYFRSGTGGVVWQNSSANPVATMPDAGGLDLQYTVNNKSNGLWLGKPSTTSGYLSVRDNLYIHAGVTGDTADGSVFIVNHLDALKHTFATAGDGYYALGTDARIGIADNLAATSDARFLFSNGTGTHAALRWVFNNANFVQFDAVQMNNTATTKKLQMNVNGGTVGVGPGGFQLLNNNSNIYGTKATATVGNALSLLRLNANDDCEVFGDTATTGKVLKLAHSDTRHTTGYLGIGNDISIRSGSYIMSGVSGGLGIRIIRYNPPGAGNGTVEIGDTTTFISIFGDTTVSAKFGCNGKAAQAAVTANAVVVGGVGTAAGGFDTAAHRDAFIALVNQIRSTLIADGIMA